MPSFEDMQKSYMNVGTHGQQLKAMADMVMQQAFDTDIGTKQCYIYDYYHDDQFDEGLYGYNPALSKTKVKVDLRFIVKAYKSAAKDDPEYHIMFKPDFWNNLDLKTDEKLQWFNQYSDLGIRFPVGLYVDIPNDKGVYQKWLIFYDEDANQFPKFGVMKCNYLFTWIKDDGIHRYKRKMWGVERTQNSYTSGTWQGERMNVLDEQGKFWLPWNKISSEVKHDMRFFISMLQDEPYVYKASKIKNTAPKGVITVTIEQDRFNTDSDYVNLDTGEMYADYYSSTIIPEEVTPEIEATTDVLSIEAKTYSVRINGGSKVVYAKILDQDGNDVTNNYSGEDLIWSFKLKDSDEDITSLILEDSTYNEANKDKYKYKFKFLGDEIYLNKIITVTLKINELSANADLDIVS
jgi:hypothetical protein